MTPLSGKQGGYSLIEVLVAFVILAMALTVLLRIFSGGLRNVDAATDYAQAVVIANAQMNSPGSIEPLQPGETAGEIEERFTWTRTISDFRLETQSTNPERQLPAYHISVEVQWADGNGTRRVAFETLRLVDSIAIAGGSK